MKITFLGSAGGRFVMLKQIRASGGWILELEDQSLHIDPGPGALVRAKQFGIDLSKVTGVLVSHRHQDHINDAVVVIECMTKGATEKRGMFASNEKVVKGNMEYPPVIDKYHIKFVERLEVLKPGKSIMVGKVKITATPTNHREEEGLGFVFEGEGLRIGFTGDGEYFAGMEKHFKDCDYLILNVLRPRTDSWPGHMNTEGARKLISRAKPKKAIIKHIGMKMLKGVAEREAAWIEKETGIKTVVARDGMVIHEGVVRNGPVKKGLEQFLEENGD
jgi:ribonuclease BN (tRNA processing enzyme)